MGTKTNTGTDPARRVHLALTERESRCILAASRALRIPTATLIWTAALEAAHVMGYCEGMAPRTRPNPGVWGDAPCRAPNERARFRMTVSCVPLHLQTLKRAALEQLGPDFRLSNHGGPAPVHAFLIGAGLRFIATQLQRARKTAADGQAGRTERRAAEKFAHEIEEAVKEDEGSVLTQYLEPGRG
jgi:hypothetical protein